ncbi:MAG: hypothetical protein HQ546_04210, partial [Planctomycetes bacterium]|nr:hypothetical protein [Planctomycetota bacterium]
FGMKGACRVLSGAVCGGAEDVLGRLANMTLNPRVELPEAFATAGDTDVQVLLLPTAVNRRVIEETMPTLPKQLGGGPSTAITRGLLWMAVGANLPPKASIRIIVQSNDPASAEALNGLIPTSLQSLKQAVSSYVPEFDKLASFLTPVIAKDRLVLDRNESKTQQVFDILVPAFRQARDNAKEAVSRANLLGIGQAINVYMANNQDIAPPDLDTLVKGRYAPEEMLVNPVTGKKLYVYIPPPKLFDPMSIMVYEDPATRTRNANRTHVLFCDVHVETVLVDDQFWEMVKKAQAASKNR